MKSGYLYVLIHPSNPNLYKIGVTTLHPEKRLRQHNSNTKEYAGKIVKETSQEWQIKVYIQVSDPYWAENVFWNATGLKDVPYRNGIEIEIMDWETVKNALNCARSAGVRPLGNKVLPDYVYAYTASMRRRLQGRGIELLGYVKSMVSGKANFRCSNGHEWKTRAIFVAEGEGCLICGIGKNSHEEIKNNINAGIVFLLINPKRDGFIRIKFVGNANIRELNFGEGWEVHRYRNVEELNLAEVLIWDLLGFPKPDNSDQPVIMDLQRAEKAFRDLHYRMQSEIAMIERKYIS